MNFKLKGEEQPNILELKNENLEGDFCGSYNEFKCNSGLFCCPS